MLECNHSRRAVQLEASSGVGVSMLPSFKVVVDGQCKVNMERSSSRKSSTVSRVKVVCCGRAHEGHVEVRVWIDPTGHHILPSAVHRLGTHRNLSTRNTPVDQIITRDVAAAQ